MKTNNSTAIEFILKYNISMILKNNNMMENKFVGKVECWMMIKERGRREYKKIAQPHIVLASLK